MTSAPAATTPLTIAVVKPCCIGDCVMALPAIESLARAFPYAHIHAFTGRHSAPVFRSSEFINMVYLTPDQLTPSRVPGLAWNLRTAGHDWIVVLDRSRLVVTAARSANPSRLVTIPRRRDAPRHEIDVYLGALEAAGVRITTTVPKMTVSDESREAASKVFQGAGGHYAVIHPGGAENPGVSMLDKRWPEDRYVSIIRALEERGIRTVLTGGPRDIDLCERIVKNANDNVTSVAGKLDLTGTAAMIEGACLYLGTDTGVSHIAAAVGTTSIVVFGPTNPERYAPRGEHVTILAPDRSRSLPDVDLRKVRSGNDYPGTDEIPAAEVLAAIDRALQPGGSGA